MAKIKGAVVVDTERCKGCNLCVVACPLDVLALTTKEVNKRGYTFAQTVLEDTCIGCASWFWGTLSIGTIIPLIFAPTILFPTAECME